jgi:hypothetical protein
VTGARKYGELVEELELGALTVVVRHSCIRRDLYELSSKAPYGLALKERLAQRGAMRGSDALYVVEIEGVHQITVASAAGRIVVMPRIETERADQRAAVLELAELIASTRDD